MPRIRTVKPEFWTDDKVLSISITARLFFIGLWSFADDNGVLENKPRQLKARIFPGDDVAVEPLIQELAENNLIKLYQVDGQQYLMVKNFRKHQVIDKPRKSCLPTPDMATNPVNGDEINGNQLKSVEINPGKGKGKGKEEEKEVRSAPPTPDQNEQVGQSATADAHPPTADASADMRAASEQPQDAPVFHCRHFDVTQDFFNNLLADYPALDSNLLLLEIKKAADYAADNNGRFKRRANGQLKNPRLFLRNWLNRVVVPPNQARAPTPGQSKSDRNIAVAQAWAAKKKREMSSDD